MSIKNILLILVMMLAVTGMLACGSDDEETTECASESFTFDNSIRPLCGIDAVANHAVIENLALNGGTFTLYARTSSDGNGGGEFAFSGTDLTVKYRGGTSGTNTVDIGGNLHWLFGIFNEAPAVHCMVKNHPTDPDALEDAAAVLEVEPGDWTNSGSPASESFYYKGSGGVTVARVRIFHEEHHHE